jgi:hypothetical protein
MRAPTDDASARCVIAYCMTLANVAAVAESGGVRTLSGSDAVDAFSDAAGSGDEASEAG